MFRVRARQEELGERSERGAQIGIEPLFDIVELTRGTVTERDAIQPFGVEGRAVQPETTRRVLRGGSFKVGRFPCGRRKFRFVA